MLNTTEPKLNCHLIQSRKPQYPLCMHNSWPGEVKNLLRTVINMSFLSDESNEKLKFAIGTSYIELHQR